jgi:hypothetical protein
MISNVYVYVYRELLRSAWSMLSSCMCARMCACVCEASLCFVLYFDIFTHLFAN